jgi:glycine/D-amino acid oxidase-like deaminating enzyme
MAMSHLKKNKGLIDFLIVGQGIAGSVLALTFIKAGYSVGIIDQPSLSSSSKIAAGIWNPVVFKRLTKSWMADALIPELFKFYQSWERVMQTQFIQERHIIKSFSEEQEKNHWLKKSQGHEPDNDFLDPHIYHDLPIDEHYLLKNYSFVNQAGSLNASHFLKETRSFLKSQCDVLEETFDHKTLQLSADSVTYKSLKATNIVFCEGHLIATNPYFNWIPMKPAKGETLTIYSEHIKLEKDIFNKGFFIMPLGKNLFKIGATYEWDVLDDIPTQEGKDELLNKLNSVITSPYRIESHEAGVRPSVIDRRPVIGKHPRHTNLFLFNGLGTKAVMLAPYFAKQLVDSILHNKTVDEDVDLNRFKNYHPGTSS